jgi:hypothetical protein
MDSPESWISLARAVTDVRGVDPQFVHEIQQPELLADGRIHHRGVLQAVPQRLVIQLDRPDGGPVEGPLERVPVVDEFVLFHGGPPRRTSREILL